MPHPFRLVENERGATLVFVALLLVALLGMSALAVDVGLWLTTRSEAQRTADAAALAGAGEYMVDGMTAAVAEATARGFAARNYVGRTTVNSGAGGDVDVAVEHAEQLVRVTVRGSTPAIFARFLGVDALPVVAQAAAKVRQAGGADCVKPFALPDIWEERSGGDANNNRVWEPGETWSFNPGVDHYKGWMDQTVPGVETGYGSEFRDGRGSPSYIRDQGRKTVIKAGEPGKSGTTYDVPFNVQPGLFLPFVIPGDPPAGTTCGIGGGGGTSGAAAYSQNICACNPTVIQIGTEYPLKTGNMVGPTKAGIEDLIALDPTATWNSSTNTINSQYGMKSPRVIKIALYDPAEVISSGKQSVKIGNIALFFVEGYENNTKNVIGRFIKYAEGSASTSPNTGTMVRVLQLVE